MARTEPEGVPDPEVFIDLDSDRKIARHVRDLAVAIRRRDFAEADLCIDLIARENEDFAEQVALGRGDRKARAA